MIFISLGDRCHIKYNIDKKFGSKETLFFDWAISDINFICDILLNHNKILNINNLIITPSKNKKNVEIIIKSVSKCVFIHDIKINYKYKDIENFLIKYSRRINRIIEYIKSTDKIYFIHHGKMKLSDKNRFINIIKKINSNCNFILVLLYNKNKEINKVINEEINEENFISLCLTKYKISEYTSWKFENYNWEKIWNDILH